MNELNEKYWTERYQKDDTGWDIGIISDPLKAYSDQLEDKTISILIPGAGNAYEAEYLFNKGFTNVTVIDLSDQPLKNIQKRIPGFPRERLICGDFFGHAQQYDLIIEQTFFCALDRSLRKKYAEKMASLLCPGGTLAGVLFNAEFNNDHPPFGGSKEEYIPLFEPYFILKTFDVCYNSIKPRANRELFMILKKK
jgi:methyl halide transferase